MNDSDNLTLYKMMTGRGSFEWHLAHACQFATTEQFAAIKHALPEVFEKYRPPGIATPGPVEQRPVHWASVGYPEKVTP